MSQSMYTVAEAAQRLHVSTSTLYRMLDRREIGCVKIGSRKTMIPAVELDDFIQSRTVDRLT